MNKVTDILLYDNSFISLHVQLHNQLRHLILSGRWVSGSRLPSENEFTSHLKISRSTVRLALQQAEVEGLIERAAGRGTFVAHQPTKDVKPRLISFLGCGFDGENHLLILNGAEREAKAHGYQIIFSHAQSYAEEMDFLTGLRVDEVAGVLLWPHVEALKQQDLSLYQQLQVPIVLMDRQIPGFECDYVTSDNYGGAHALMQHLVDLGHQTIVFLSHHETQLSPVMDRYRAYSDVLQAAGLTPLEPWVVGEPGKEISANYALRSSVDQKSPELQQIKNSMLNAQPRPTAIFALNDYVAVLAIRAMKSLNLRIPGAVSIAGFDDSDIALHLEVPLTTVAQDPLAIGKRATQLLINRLEGYSGPINCEFLPTQLRVRSSTGTLVRV